MNSHSGMNSQRSQKSLSEVAESVQVVLAFDDKDGLVLASRSYYKSCRCCYKTSGDIHLVVDIFCEDE